MNLSELKKRIAQSREFTIKHGDFELIVRRPTADEAQGMQPSERTPEGLYQSMLAHYECVQGWNGVTERHFIPEANGIDVPFDRELLPELIDRNRDLGGELVTRIYDEFKAFQQQEEQEKKA